MKRFLWPFLFLSITVSAQNKMTPELLWSLKRVSGEGLSQDGKSVLYASKTYDVKTEKSTTKLYSLNLLTGEKKKRDLKPKRYSREIKTFGMQGMKKQFTEVKTMAKTGAFFTTWKVQIIFVLPQTERI